jgi:hypothetical protein
MGCQGWPTSQGPELGLDGVVAKNTAATTCPAGVARSRRRTAPTGPTQSSPKRRGPESEDRPRSRGYGLCRAQRLSAKAPAEAPSAAPIATPTPNPAPPSHMRPTTAPRTAPSTKPSQPSRVIEGMGASVARRRPLAGSSSSPEIPNRALPRAPATATNRGLSRTPTDRAACRSTVKNRLNHAPTRPVEPTGVEGLEPSTYGFGDRQSLAPMPLG